MISLKKIWTYRKGKWALSIICFFAFLAIIGDFIANEKPMYCEYNGESYFPIAHEYGEQLGVLNHYKFLKTKSWQQLDLENAIYPIIKFVLDLILVCILKNTG